MPRRWQRVCKGKSLVTVQLREPHLNLGDPKQFQELLHRHISCDISNKSKKITISHNSSDKPLDIQQSDQLLSIVPPSDKLNSDIEGYNVDYSDRNSSDSKQGDQKLLVPDVVIVNQHLTNPITARRSVMSKQS